MSKRLKVLVSAYACSPYKGSEPGVGWGFVAALAQHHDLWVIVEEEKFRADIERYLAENPEFSQSVRFVFLKKQRNRFLRKLWPPSYYWYYRRWHEAALGLARELHREVGFDLAHQLTMVGFREPGYLWQLGIPFVWGPVGGMGLFPWSFMPIVGGYGALYYCAYNLFNACQMHFSSRPRLAARAAGAGLIAATPENRYGARKFWGCSSVVITEVGLPREPLRHIAGRKEGEALRLVWTGLHIPRKALNLALHALSLVSPKVSWRLDILGTGEQTSVWRRLTVRLGVADRCYFHGWIERDQALAVMQNAHVMLITSLRDLTSTVTVEALALGVPIICLDHCGFSEVVDDSCGIKVPLTSIEQTVADFSRAVESLGRDELRRRQLANGALIRAQRFAWVEKARLVDEIYRARVQTGHPESGL